MIELSDFVYSLSLGSDKASKYFIQALYRKDEQLFIYYLRQHFVSCYQKDILRRLKIKSCFEFYDQRAINEVFKRFALLFHTNVNTTYLQQRQITEQQVERFCLGSTHVLDNESLIKTFIKHLKEQHSQSLIDLVLNYHLRMRDTTQRLYSSSYFATFPSFDSKNRCQGICYRTERFEKRNKYRNLHKFFVSHAPSFIFNLETVEKHDELILVEGVFDVLALDRIGIHNSIALAGNKISKYQYQQLKFKKLHLLYDCDRRIVRT